MFRDGVSDRDFRAAVERLRVQGMGTEVVAPLLSHLIYMTRPRSVLEVGMGYTTPFLARALADVEEMVVEEAPALVAKTQPYLDSGRALDDEWLNADPALLVPEHYTTRQPSRFVAVDDMSGTYTSAPRVQAVLEDLGLADRVTLVNAELRDCVELLPAGFLPIDFAWVDTWDCLYFFDKFWPYINPGGGMVAFHYLMTYPEGEAVLDYIATSQRLHPGEFEVLNLLESQKMRQNSLTVIRRTSGEATRQYGEVGHKARLDDQVRKDVMALADRTAAADQAP